MLYICTNAFISLEFDPMSISKGQMVVLVKTNSPTVNDISDLVPEKLFSMIKIKRIAEDKV